MLKNTLKLTEICSFAHSVRISQHKYTVLCSPLLNKLTNIQQFRGKRDNGKKNDSSNLSSLFIPVPVKPNPDDINVGAELTGPVNKSDLLKILNKFYQKKEIKYLCAEYGLDQNLQHQAYIGFRKYCLDAAVLPEDLHVVVSDILQGAGHVDDIFPYFLRFAKQMFPHLEYMDELKNESDLRTPAAWYPEARKLTRKIIFHAGPTNSGKTYHALERFMTSKSGVYCGPLKLLANEVFIKTNDRGIPCDLVTGEERKYVQGEGNEASHVSCTVEMTNFKAHYDVAVIDEIQMMKDMGRGWAWTRALLGIIADEIHVCGEAGAIDLIQQLCLTTNETVEVREYKRLTELAVEDKALGGLENVEPGDCIVCFSKNDIYSVSRTIEGLGKEVAVIYGGLPPGTKLAQAKKFNDVNHSCKILVATDAIGMGLNLSIRRVIFYSLIKPKLNEKGEKEMDTISVSSALQIAGRAGRYGTQWEKGFVTTYRPDDLQTLKHILSQFPEPITQAGLLPTANQIQTYSMYLPNATLSNIMDIFVSLCRLDDSLYFMCNIEDFKFLADLIQHVPLPLVVRYDFCCAPINKKMPFVCMMFTKFARQYSKNETITYSWLRRTIGWPLAAPKNLIDLVQLETVFDVLDLYLWLSYRFSDLFPDANIVREMQQELDLIIQDGVFQLTRLVKNSEGTGVESFGENWNTGRRKRNISKESTEKSLSEELGVGKGRLTDRLLSQGLLTPAMLKELRKEWNQSEDPGPPNGNNKPSGKAVSSPSSSVNDSQTSEGHSKQSKLKHSNLSEAEIEKIQSLVAKVLLFSKGKPLRSTVEKRIKNLPKNRPLTRVKKTITSKIDETPEKMRALERERKLKLKKQREANETEDSSGLKRKADADEWKIWTRTQRKMRAIPDKRLKTRHEKRMWTIRDRQVRAKPERQGSLMDFENIPSTSSEPTRDRISFMDVDPTPYENINLPSTSRGHASSFRSSFQALDKTLSPEGSDTYYDSSADDTSDDDDDDYIDITYDDDLSSFNEDSEMSSDEDTTTDDENINNVSENTTLMPTESYSSDSEENRGRKRTVSMMSVEYSSPSSYSKTQFGGKDRSFASVKLNSFENVHRDRKISFMSVEYSSPSNEDLAAYQKNGNCKKRRRTSAAAGRPSKRTRYFAKDGFSDEDNLTGVIDFEYVPSSFNGNPKVLVESISDYRKRWYGQVMNFEV